MADAHWAHKEQGLTNAKHITQWPAYMKHHVHPHIGDRPVASITHAEVLEVLKPIWFKIPVTAKRVLQRMDAVFKSAIVREQRERASPCIGVAQELGVQRREIKHHPALPYSDVGAFIARLRICNSGVVTKLAFEWLILTAVRSGEVRGAVWPEIDEAQALWVIPKERMGKTRRPHVVPLAPRCLKILRRALATSLVSTSLR